MPPTFPMFHQPIVLIDLDDTLAINEGYDPQNWQDIGDPREYSKEFVWWFKKFKWKTCLWSSRSAFESMREWLEKHDFSDKKLGEGLFRDEGGILLIDHIGTTPETCTHLCNPAKPLADLIIDNACWPWCGDPVPLKDVMTDLLKRGKLKW